MREFQINGNEAGQRLDKYLHRLLPQAANSFLHKMLRKKNIVLNGKKASGDVRIASGDLVTCYLSEETFDKFSRDGSVAHEAFAAPAVPLEVLYEDADILIINKPAGMLSQKASPKDISANEYIIRYLLERGELTPEALRTFRPAVCNRLDRNTSGILIAGKSLCGLQEMALQLKSHDVEKYYRCIACGNLEEPKLLKGWLCKDHKKNIVRVFDEKQPDSQYIETAYTPLQQYQDNAGCKAQKGLSYTLLEVRLITGRPHQIRAHLASAGHAVVGDVKYGDPKINEQFRKRAGLKRQLLHAYRIVLKGRAEVTAPLPKDFKRVLEMLRPHDMPR